MGNNINYKNSAPFFIHYGVCRLPCIIVPTVGQQITYKTKQQKLGQQNLQCFSTFLIRQILFTVRIVYTPIN